jgi:hypothetical protein
MSDPAASFICAVQGTMARHQCGWTDAWNRTRALQPELYERLMTAKSPRIVQLANAEEAIQKRHAAQTNLISKVHQAMDRKGLTYDQAWNEVRTTEAELYNEATGDGQSVEGFRVALGSNGSGASSAAKGSPTAPPVWGPQNLASLALPAGTPADIAVIAWSANGFQVSLAQPREVWSAIVSYFKALNTPDAEAHCRQSFPELYRRFAGVKS